MGEPRPAHPVKLFSGLLARAEDVVFLEDQLSEIWGPIDSKSEVFKFSYSKYYAEELGPEPFRWFVSFKKMIDPESVREYKIQSNDIENKFSLNGLRRFNVDPGFVDLDKIVLATTKPATYRIYLGKGIYAQSTLYYKAGRFVTWPWTYRDYQEEKTLLFFKEVRKKFKIEFDQKIGKLHG